MVTKIKVCLLGFVALIFSIYGYKTCEKAIFNFNQTDQCFKNVTYELSPLFDAHSIMIVDSQVKAAHGLITFEEYCKNIKEAKETIKKHLKNYENKINSQEERLLLDKLKIRCEDTFKYLDKIEKICKEKDALQLKILIENGELYTVVDKATETINEILEKEMVISSVYTSESVKSLKQFEKFISIFMGLSIVMCVAVFIPMAKAKKTRKRVK